MLRRLLAESPGIEVVAESQDGSALLVGEVKWSRRVDWRREEANLRQKAANLTLARGRRVRLALWTPSTASRPRGEVQLAGRIRRGGQEQAQQEREDSDTFRHPADVNS